MKNIMTKDNIESIVISAIINEVKDYEILTKDITYDFFKNRPLRLAFEFLKRDKYNNSTKNIEEFLLKINIDSEKIKRLINMKIDYSSSEIKSFFIEVYKQRLIEEKTKEIQKETNQEEKEKKIKELQEVLQIKSNEHKISNGKYCLAKYKKYLENAQYAFENYNGILGISTGIPSLNEKIIGLKNIEYILVAARPSMGKTSLTTGMFIEAIADENIEGVPVFFSIEMEMEQIMGKMVAQMNDNLELSHTIFGKDREDTKVSIEESLEFFESKNFYIEDFASDDGGRKLSISPEDLDHALSEIVKKESKIKAIFIDYIQLLSPSDKRLLGQNERVTSISSELKALGRKYGCPIIALSQLNRDLEKRQDKRPQLSDLRDSGSLEQDADIIMFVYRPEVYLEKEIAEKLKNRPNDTTLERQLQILRSRPFSEAEIIIGKQRNGPTGIVNTYFHKKNTRFGDIEDETIEMFDEIYGPTDIYEEENE